ncbi:MAG: TetR/AcrR family transcriptional regulator [Verrucomicrobiota bacterium]|nr:TetR/AcrR family transcriptional regulator [Verrucomicrobiota bacterium]
MILSKSMIANEVPLDGRAAGLTKERLLVVAGELFADRGFDSVSLRMITDRANVNLASVNYHFGSKEELIGAVVDDIVRPVNERRLSLLSLIDYTTQDPIRKIIHAFIDPVFDLSDSGNDDNKYYKLISRCIASRDERVSSIIIKQFPEVLAQFVSALTKALPRINSNSAHLKIMFMAGALAHSLFHYENLLLISEGRFDLNSTEVLKSELVSFLLTGMNAS